jgi:hypothetical protein
VHRTATDYRGAGTRGVESVDWNTKLLIDMLRYQNELGLSFLPEPVTDNERKKSPCTVPFGVFES